jgi:hypothetical protein
LLSVDVGRRVGLIIERLQLGANPSRSLFELLASGNLPPDFTSPA